MQFSFGNGIWKQGKVELLVTDLRKRERRIFIITPVGAGVGVVFV